jgi:hypothetical protein
MGNKSFESVRQFRYLGKTLTNENSIYPEIKSRFKTGNACYNSMQNLLPSSLLSENTNIKIQETPLIRTLVIRIADYLDRFGPSGKSVENSTKLTYLEITGDRINMSRALWLLELQIRRGRKI